MQLELDMAHISKDLQTLEKAIKIIENKRNCVTATRELREKFTTERLREEVYGTRN